MNEILKKSNHKNPQRHKKRAESLSFVSSFKITQAQRKKIGYLVEEGFALTFSEFIRSAVQLYIMDCFSIMKQEDEIKISEDLKNE